MKNKQRFASTEVEASSPNITPGKLYPIKKFTPDESFVITNDDGMDLFCLPRGCSHLGGKNWSITSAPNEQVWVAVNDEDGRLDLRNIVPLEDDIDHETGGLFEGWSFKKFELVPTNE